jgi:hypothetical protein
LKTHMLAPHTHTLAQTQTHKHTNKHKLENTKLAEVSGRETWWNIHAKTACCIQIPIHLYSHQYSSDCDIHAWIGRQ